MTEFAVYITNGQITNKKAVRNHFDALPDGRYMVKVEKARKRSLPQNSYYWSVCVPMVKDGLRQMGFEEVRTNDDAHLVMKALFLKRHFSNPETGEAIEWIESTAKLKTVEFNEFLESVWKWSAVYLGIQIPQPGEQRAMYE